MRPIVQSLWIGTQLPSLHFLGIRSFLEHGHEFHLYAYDEIAGVPDGTTICDAASILPRDRIFCYQSGFGKGSYSAFSNLFRYALLFARGGWWVDTDVVCLKPFHFGNEFVFATERKQDSGPKAASCVIKSPPGAEFLRYCIDVCEAKDTDKIVWGEIGPQLIDDAVSRFKLGDCRVPAHVFNPIDYFDFRSIIVPGFDMSKLADSYGVHLWHQKWKSHYLDPDDDGPPDSLYGQLRKRYLHSTIWEVDPVTRLTRNLAFQKRSVQALEERVLAAEQERTDYGRQLESVHQYIVRLQQERDCLQQAYDRLMRDHAQLSQEHLQLQNAHTTLDENHWRLTHDRALLEAELSSKREQLARVVNSTSWRITAPLRSVYQGISTIRGRRGDGGE